MAMIVQVDFQVSFLVDSDIDLSIGSKVADYEVDFSDEILGTLRLSHLSSQLKVDSEIDLEVD